MNKNNQRHDISHLIGKKFNRLTILKDLGTNAHSKRVVLVRCDCGVVKIVAANQVKSGGTKSCGCLNIEKLRQVDHGLSKHPLHSLWSRMKKRCYSMASHNYHSYGGRGVTVCDEWRNDFMAFYNWAISNGWKRGLSLDKDKKAPGMNGIEYSPKYCTFLSAKENQRYKITSRFVEYRGETKSLVEWSEILGLNYKRAGSRLRRGFSVEEAFFAPLRRKKNKLCHSH